MGCGQYPGLVSVSCALRDKVLKRDGWCFLSREQQPPFAPGANTIHRCADQWGMGHPSNAVGMLSIDHVHDGYGMMGKRAPDDERWLVAMCYNSNIAGPSRAVRQAEREYLAYLYDR